MPIPASRALRLGAMLLLASCRAESQMPSRPVRETVDCEVTRVIDGDTVRCDGLGSVRLIGIDAPERSQPPHYARSRAALLRLVPEGTTVQLERDVDARDRNGRVLGYLWRDGRLVNWQLVRDGFAITLTYPPNVQYVDAFASAQREARAAKAGLWADGGFDCAPVEHRRGRC